MCTKDFLLSGIITDFEEMTNEERAFFSNPCERNYEELRRANAHIDLGQHQR